MDKIDWDFLSANPNAIHLLRQNPDKIYWRTLSTNPNIMALLETNVDKIDWNNLSVNPSAIYLLQKNQDKINWNLIFSNPMVFEINYTLLQHRIEPFKEELIAKCVHPTCLVRYFEKYKYDIGEDEYSSEED